MSPTRPGVLLFRLPDQTSSAIPAQVSPGSFEELGVLEVQHLERWISAQPDVLGEPLLVITTQFAGFDRTKERSDILALDRNGRLVIVELKRDDSGSRQDLQALRYAAYSSTLTLSDLLAMFVEHQSRQGAATTVEEARKTFEAHAVGIPLEETLDQETKPRIILVAKSFQDEVAWTSLWLRQTYGVDISCIEVVPYRIDEQLLLTSSIRIPLPEVADFEVKRDTKRQRSQAERRLDWQRVREVVAAIPPGRWMSYGDVAEAAGGSRTGGMAVGGSLANSPDVPPSVHRVLRETGEVSPGFHGEIGGPNEARALLESEGLVFDERKRADPKSRFQPD